MGELNPTREKIINQFKKDLQSMREKSRQRELRASHSRDAKLKLKTNRDRKGFEPRHFRA